MDTKKIDIPNLNKEAQLNAIKHVCNVFQRPHQLEKVDQHKKRILRKNVSVFSFRLFRIKKKNDGKSS